MSLSLAEQERQRFKLDLLLQETSKNIFIAHVKERIFLYSLIDYFIILYEMYFPNMHPPPVPVLLWDVYLH